MRWPRSSAVMIVCNKLSWFGLFAFWQLHDAEKFSAKKAPLASNVMEIRPRQNGGTQNRWNLFCFTARQPEWYEMSELFCECRILSSQSNIVCLPEKNESNNLQSTVRLKDPNYWNKSMLGLWDSWSIAYSCQWNTV